MSKSMEIIQSAADRFHKILSAFTARRLLADNPRLTRVMIDSFTKKLMTSEQIEKELADGFEECVLELQRLGDPTVTVHECRAEDIDEIPSEIHATELGSFGTLFGRHPCDSCDPSFSCFDGSSKCRKVPL